MPKYQQSTSQPASTGTNKTAVAGLLIAAAAIAGGLWWWISNSEQLAEPTPTPLAQDENLEDLNQLNADVDLDSEFQQVDQDLNNL